MSLQCITGQSSSRILAILNLSLEDASQGAFFFFSGISGSRISTILGFSMQICSVFDSFTGSPTRRAILGVTIGLEYSDDIETCFFFNFFRVLLVVAAIYVWNFFWPHHLDLSHPRNTLGGIADFSFLGSLG